MQVAFACPTTLTSAAVAPPSQRRLVISCAASAVRRAVVIGGGIGGLTAAARLAKEGLDVTLLEQGSQVGGRCQSITQDVRLPADGHSDGCTSKRRDDGGSGRFRFDTGASLLLFPDTYRETYRMLGHNLADHVELRRVEPAAYRVHYEGAGHLDLLYDDQRMMEQLEGVEAGSGVRYLQWLASARTALQVGMRNFIERDFDGLLDFADPRKLLPLLGQVDVMELLGQHDARLARRFKDPRIRALFSFQDLYVGLSPYNAPGVFSLLAATELTDGVWYPMGGFGKIRDTLRTIAEGHGVKVVTDCTVAAINTDDRSCVTGVTTRAGEELVIAADLVVSNRDVPLTYGLLTGGAAPYGLKQEERIAAMDYSAGVIAFYWCINRSLPALLHHNVFLSADFEASWRRATSRDTLRRAPNFYVHVPSRTDPDAAPPGCESVMVLLPVANMQEVAAADEAAKRSRQVAKTPRPLDSNMVRFGDSGYEVRDPRRGPRDMYADLVEAGRDAVFRALVAAGVCGSEAELRESIVQEEVTDPEQWGQRCSLQHGAAFGLSHNLRQLAVLRPAVKDARVAGLYLTGASARPGNGVPLVMISGRLAAERVLQDIKAVRI